MVNPASLMKIMNSKKVFESNHPKFVAFLSDVFGRGIEEGTIIEITVTKPDGTPVTSNIKVRQSDLDLVEELKNLK